MTFYHDQRISKWSWTRFAAIGSPASFALTRGGWRYQDLATISNRIKQGHFELKEIEEVRESVRKRRDTMLDDLGCQESGWFE